MLGAAVHDPTETSSHSERGHKARRAINRHTTSQQRLDRRHPHQAQRSFVESNSGLPYCVGETALGVSMYAAPRHIEELNNCYFYHTMDLPEVGTVAGDWDLRGRRKICSDNRDHLTAPYKGNRYCHRCAP